MFAIFAFANAFVLQMNPALFNHDLQQHKNGGIDIRSPSLSSELSSSSSSAEEIILLERKEGCVKKKLQEKGHRCDTHDCNIGTKTLSNFSFSRRHIFCTLTTIGIICTTTTTTATVLSPSSNMANAISSTEAESSYDKYAPTYDALDGGSLADSLGIEKARLEIISMAKGNVLEIGSGTGLNLDKYTFASSSSSHGAMDGVTSLTLLDVSEGMMSQARDKLLKNVNVPEYVHVSFVKADATKDLIDLYGTEGYFDTVVDTFSLCVMGNEGAKNCLRQLQNVVKKDSGRILLIENARSSNSALGLYQDLTANAAAQMGGKGCISNQNVGGFIRSIPGLELVKEEEYAMGVFRSYVCKRIM